MEISVQTMQIMRLASTASVPHRLVYHLRGHILEEVENFRYLGSICSTDMSMQPEIANRLSRASGAYHILKRLKVWGDRDNLQRIKMVLYKVTVQSIMVMGVRHGPALSLTSKSWRSSR